MFGLFRKKSNSDKKASFQYIDIQPEIVTIKKFENNIFTKFETIPDFKDRLESSLEAMTQYLETHTLVDGSMVDELYADYSRVRDEIQKFERLVTEFKKLREEKKGLMEELKKQSEGHELTRQNYELKIKELTPEIPVDVIPVDVRIAQAVEEVNKRHESEKAGMTAEIEALKKEVNELRETVSSQEQQNFEYKKRIEDLSIELAKYMRVVDSYLSNTSNEAAIQIPKKPDLAFVFSTSCGSKICEFLAVKQILKIRQCSKFFALAIRNRGDYSLVLAKNEIRLCARNKAAYIRDIDLYQKRAGELEDEYSKHCFTKYVWLREKAADYMPAVLATAESLLNMPSTEEKKSADQDQGKWGFLRPKLQKDEKAGSGQSLFIKEFENNPRCIFIKTDAFKHKAEARRSFFDSVKLAIDEYHAGISKKITVFLEKDNREFFCQLLSQLMGFSRALLQETKELEAIKDILLQKLEEKKEVLRHTSEEFEFTKMRLNAEKKSVTDCNNQIEKLKEEIKNAENTINSLHQHTNQLEAENDELLNNQKNTDSKLVLLAKEVKSLRTKNRELEEFNKDAHSGIAIVRRVFDELRL